MRSFRFIILCVSTAMLSSTAAGQAQAKKSPTFSKEIFPMIKTYCLPCHLAENENPSQLALDNYETLVKGGEHGNPIVATKPKESNLYLKLLADPPFGKQMPRSRKKPTEQEIKVIYDWIEAGGKKDSTEVKPSK
ncbi:MAG: c-type cytochrome domain-containing protein [Bacteroidota bacterium]